jgi:hypothetical protein
MQPFLLPVAATGLLAAAASAQSSFLFNTSQQELTMSNSGGTVLKDLRPNEVVHVEFFPCPVISAEKWAPTTCYQTMAGNENGGPVYYNPALFGSIDALVEMPSPVNLTNPRTLFFSPDVAMGTAISGAPGLRPGDTGRIVQSGGQDGQVQYFLRAEDVQQALGMPLSPIVVDVDAIAANPGFGIFFSVDQTHTINNVCNVTTIQDGDVLMIPPNAITWTWDLRVQSVLPNSAQVVYTEAQMDTFVVAAGVNDHLGNCVTQIVDLEALEIDYAGAGVTIVTCPGNILTVPALIFTAETGTGASVLTTDLGGQIYVAGCGPLGRSCGSPPTLGDQMGLRPPGGGFGVPSYVNALVQTWTERFVIEPQQHVVAQNTPWAIDMFNPCWVAILALKLAPPTVAASIPQISWQYFPDLYVANFGWSSPPNWGTGFQTVACPPIPGSCHLVAQAGGITFNLSFVLSTPAMVDVP